MEKTFGHVDIEETQLRATQRWWNRIDGWRQWTNWGGRGRRRECLRTHQLVLFQQERVALWRDVVSRQIEGLIFPIRVSSFVKFACWQDGRVEANKILMKHSQMGDGTFLVRESETHPGDYTLSFVYNGKTCHSRIRSTYSPDGQVRYQLHEAKTFSTLYELIDYYQQKPMKSELFQELYLKNIVPQTDTHVDKPWFYPNSSRSEAEDILRRLKHDGVFLVRKSEKHENKFSISFRWA